MKKTSDEIKSLKNKKHSATKQQLISVSEDSQKNEKKKNTSLRLKKQTLKALKIRAIEQETSIQHLIEALIEDYLLTGQ